MLSAVMKRWYLIASLLLYDHRSVISPATVSAHFESETIGLLIGQGSSFSNASVISDLQNRQLLTTASFPDGEVIQEVPDPETGAMYLNMIPLTDNPRDARCIDGSPAGYYFRPGYDSGQRSFLIVFQGGGWCYDMESCFARQTTNGKGSTVGKSRVGKTSDHHRAYLSIKKSDNPFFYNWNMAWLFNCDSSSFMGDRQILYKGALLHFNGKANRNAIIDHLLREKGMTQAERVLVTGGSAGAHAVFMNIDQIASQIHQYNQKVDVRGMPDSGFFLDYTSDYPMPLTHKGQGNEASIHGHLDTGNVMRNVFTFTNMSAGAHPECLKEQQQQLTESPAWDTEDITMSEGLIIKPMIGAQCVFVANVAPHLRTPVFPLQSRYDPLQLEHYVSPDFTMDQANEYGARIRNTMMSQLLYEGNPGHGAFLESCYHHTIHHCPRINAWTGHLLASESPIRVNPSHAVALWMGLANRPQLKETKNGKKFFFEQNHPYPCSNCCECNPAVHHSKNNQQQHQQQQHKQLHPQQHQ